MQNTEPMDAEAAITAQIIRKHFSDAFASISAGLTKLNKTMFLDIVMEVLYQQIVLNYC